MVCIVHITVIPSLPEGQEAGANVMDGAPPELEDEICLYTNNRLDCLNGSNGGVDVSAGRNTGKGTFFEALFYIKRVSGF